MYKKIALISCILFNVNAAEKGHPTHTAHWWVYFKKVENISKYWCCCLWPFIQKKRQKLENDGSKRQIITFANPLFEESFRNLHDEDSWNDYNKKEEQ